MADKTDPAPGFAALGIRRELLGALSTLGYEEPTPIQREAIPALLSGRDVLGQAATGTGKTAAFALPILERLAEAGGGPAPIALVLVPTRELAVQVAEAVYKYGAGISARVLPVYGGQPIGRQLRALERRVDVVVATPGRALDHIERGTLRLDQLQVVVLDEADEMLDMGFAEDIDAILAKTPEQRQTVLFSATMPPRIREITRRHLKQPVEVTIKREALSAGELPKVRQTAYMVARPHKTAALGRVLDVESPSAALVFCRTRAEVDEVSQVLRARGYRAETLHGGMSQAERDRVMRSLRSGSAELIVATDVAARGLDIEQLTHVINFSMPSAPEPYVHRIGRVGRAGRTGVAITLAEPREHHLLRNIERITKQHITFAKLPTVADLRAQRLELTRAALREALLSGELDGYRVVVESLSEEFDVMNVALAAVKIAHQASGADPESEPEIPDLYGAERSRGPRPGRRDSNRPGSAEGAGYKRRPQSAGPTTRVFVGAGRTGGVRPQDLVGAIANEAGLSGRAIGSIEIADRFSLVEVPEAAAEDVIRALRATLIKGRKVTVRREKQAR